MIHELTLTLTHNQTLHTGTFNGYNNQSETQRQYRARANQAKEYSNQGRALH